MGAGGVDGWKIFLLTCRNAEGVPVSYFLSSCFSSKSSQPLRLRVQEGGMEARRELLSVEMAIFGEGCV